MSVISYRKKTGAFSRRNTVISRRTRSLWQAHSALRLHLAFPSGPQDARTTTIVLVKKFDGEDAIAPEMPKRLTQLAPGRQHAHRLGITDDHRPDGALGVLRLSVSIADAYLAPTANP
jgi:hypothetical protein